MPFNSGLTQVALFAVCLIVLWSFSCEGRDAAKGELERSAVPVVFLSTPKAAPRSIEFKFQASPSQISNLRNGVAKIRNGANRAQVISILGPPSKQQLTSHKEKPNDITGRLYYYDVRIVDPGGTNAFDQQLVLDFDYRTDQLQQIMSSVPEIR